MQRNEMHICFFKTKKTEKENRLHSRSHRTNRQLKLLSLADRSGGGHLPTGTDHWVESCRVSTRSFSSGES